MEWIFHPINFGGAYNLFINKLLTTHFIKEAKNGELLARAIQHEFDHLDGKLFIDHCRNRFSANEVLQKFNLPPVEEDRLIDEDFLEEEIAAYEREHPEILEERRKERESEQ